MEPASISGLEPPRRHERHDASRERKRADDRTVGPRIPVCYLFDEEGSTRPEDLLVRVVDRASFVEFLEALAQERLSLEESGAMSSITADQLSGGCISVGDFLDGCVDYFDEKPFHKPESEASWRVFANVLYHGKFVE